MAPRVRWGGSGWKDAPGLRERTRSWKCHWNHCGEEGKDIRRGQVDYSPYMQVIVLFGNNSNQKEWWSRSSASSSCSLLICNFPLLQQGGWPHYLRLSVLFSSSDYMYSGLRIAGYCGWKDFSFVIIRGLVQADGSLVYLRTCWVLSLGHCGASTGEDSGPSAGAVWASALGHCGVQFWLTGS